MRDAFQCRETLQGTTIIEDGDGVRRWIEYSASTNVIPDQHLIISRDAPDRLHER